MTFFSWIDIRTLLASQAPIAAVFAISLFAVRRIYTNVRGIQLLAIAFLLWVPATALVVTVSFFRPGFLASLSSIGGNLLTIGCYVLLYRGVVAFFDSKGVVPLLYDIASIAAAVIIYFSLVYDTAAPRVVALSLVVALSRALIAVELLSKARGRTSNLVFAGFSILFAVLPVSLALLTIFHGAISGADATGTLSRSAFQSFNVLSDLVFLSGCGLFTLSRALEQGYEDTRQSGQFDFLTGTLNRRAIEEYLTVEIARSSRTHSPVSIMMIEVDHFGTLGAIHGTAKTDEVLCTVVKTIGSILRFYDKCGRIADDKFLVLLPENFAEHALVIATRFREALKSSSLPHDQPAITLSIGITQSAFKELTAEVLARAELALIDARRKGRDCASLGYPALAQLQSVPSASRDRVTSGSRRIAKVSR